jgi:hypothetical protein
MGNADGSVIDRLDYAATGDLASTPGGLFFDADNDGDIDLTDWSRAGNGFAACLLGPGDFADDECLLNDFDRDGEVDLRDAALFQRFFSGAGTSGPLAASRNGNYAHDADGDLDIDLDDYSYSLGPCLDTPTDPRCVAVHDFDQQHAANGMVNFGDYQGFQACAGEPGEIPPDECFRPGPGGVKPTSGSFALHGAMVDVLDADGPAGPAAPLPLQKNRARYFDLKNGRWLQRDPKPYVDGPSLYEGFGGNAAAKSDPSGEGLLTLIFVGDSSLSDRDFLAQHGLLAAAGGFVEGFYRAEDDVSAGAVHATTQTGLQVADSAVLIAEVGASKFGLGFDYQPHSELGRSLMGKTDTFLVQVEVAQGTVEQVATLGAANVYHGLEAYARTGDANALARNVGGPAYLTLALAPVGELARAPTARVAVAVDVLEAEGASAILVRRVQAGARAPGAGPEIGKTFSPVALTRNQLVFPFAESEISLELQGEAALLRPYGGPGGGHHVLAKSAFVGAQRYDANAALAVPNAELARLGVDHGLVTGGQIQGYRAFAQTGAKLTWESVEAIETQALIRAGMQPSMARVTVQQGIQALKNAGVSGPTRIPWGGR